MEESEKTKLLITSHPINTVVPSLTQQQSIKVRHINTENEHSSTKLTPDDMLNFIGMGPFQIIAFFLTSLTYLSYALDSSIFVFLTDNVMKEFNLTATQYTVLPATTGLSNVFGAFFFSYSTDRFGRVWPYIICLVWIGVFSVASGFANSFPLLVAMRLLASLAIGGVNGLTFPTLVEFLPVKNRGKISVLILLVGSIGTVVSTGLAWWLIPNYTNGWRYYIMACGVPMLLVAMFRLVFYFESPRFLITRGKTIKAWKVFLIIARFNFKDLAKYVSFDEFKYAMEKEHTNKSKQRMIFIQLLEIFKPKYLRITLPLTIINITESFGYLSSQLFLPEFVEKQNVDKYFTVLVSALAQIPGLLLMSIIIEWPRIGRLNSLRLFALLSALFFLLLALIQTEVSIPILVVFIYFSSCPNLSLIYTYVSEVYPTQIRSVSTAYFYTLQALSYLVGAFISNAALNVSFHWLFPAIWSVIFCVQFVAALVLNYEPYNQKLFDVL